MFKPEKMHVELTDKCNAQCPMCARTDIMDISKTTEAVKNVEITFDEFKNITKNVKFKKYSFCGNYGDPLSAKDFLKIVEYVADESTEIKIYTNGSLKTPDYFKRLGNILSVNPNNIILFAIDGLEDTHHIYRRNTNFNKIIENAKAYIENTNAQASWEYLVFDHNKHQVHKALEMAKELGFSNFDFRFSNRFPKNGQVSFYDKGKLNTIKKAKFETKFEYYDKIKCRVMKSKEVFLSAQGYLWPCCWTAGGYKFDKDLQEIIKKCGIETLNAKNHSILEIMDGMIWTEIQNRWEYNRPNVCQIKCTSNSKTVENHVALQR